MSNKLPTVPWTSLFPGLDHRSDIIRDSMRRKNGERHYRVKLRLPHKKLAHVQALLAPYGFHASAWGTWKRYDQMGCIKCIRHTAGA